MASATHQSGPRRTLGASLVRLGLRSGPLRWDRPPPEAEPDDSRSAAPGPVDVVLPVHGAHDELAACLESLANNTDFSRHRLVVVVDGDPGWCPELLDPLRGAQPSARLEVLVNERCRGYVYSTNRGMESGRHSDVVLLNSDTVVSAGWLEKMLQAATSRPDVGTVTPFSNNATLCSLPEPWTSNELPTGYGVDRFAALVERVAARSYPLLPTGVGFCLLVRRRCLEEVGPFDEDAFGVGYGEETDFCLRALKAGFVHLLDDATFVFHHGERSFGNARVKQVEMAEQLLTRRHPEYVATLAAFMDQDPLWTLRRRVRWAARSDAGRTVARGVRRVLHVVHGWPPYNHAGTEFYAHALAHRQKACRDVAVYTRIQSDGGRFGDVTEIDDDGVLVRLVVNNFEQRSPLSRNALRSRILERDFGRFLGQFAPDLVHMHHLAGHVLSLPEIVAARRLPLVYQVQDWWALCARANLAHRSGSLCPGPSPARCANCLPLTGVPGAAILNPLLYRYRHRLAERSLTLADAYVMGSRAIEGDYRKAGLLHPGARAYVLPYGVEIPESASFDRGVPSLPLRFGYVGSIQPHKGVHVAVEAFQGIEPTGATLSVWGDLGIDPSYIERLRALASPGVEFRGRFEEADKSGIFGAMDVLLLPSIGLESFGLVAREAFAHGVPVIASRRGALTELFAQDGFGGTWIEPGDSEGLRRLVTELVGQPGRVADWRQRSPTVVGLGEHAEMIEQVYADVLAARRGGSRS